MDDLVRAVASADAGIVAMKRDAFRDITHCNKMFDFITMRKPALVSRTSAVHAYFGDDCFEMFESADPVDLARAIRRLHEDPERRAQLVARATQRNERYRWPRQRAQYLRIVRRVLPRDPRRAEGVLRSVE
jgi:glycosyltransferase involved in cell wall biosynthesis